MYTGLGDVPIEDVARRAVNDRLSLKAARNAAGQPDAFDLATVLSVYKAGSNMANAGPMVTQEILGRAIQPFETARHSIKRDDYMKAISLMEGEIARLQGVATGMPAPTPTSGPTPILPTPIIPTPITTPAPVAVTTPAPIPIPSVATPAPAPVTSVSTPAPATNVSVTTTSAPTTPAAVAASFDWQKYLPYALGGGILLFALSKARNSKTKRAA